MRAAIGFAVVLVLSACATPYGKYGIAGGYKDSRIDENTFSVSVSTNGFTDQQTTSMHALYRAAELTVENGFDYFVIVGEANDSRMMMMNSPGSSRSNTTIQMYGNTGQATTRTTHGPTTTVPIVLPNSTLQFKSFKGVKPDNVAGAYDARSVMQYLGPQIGIEPTKRK